MIPIKKEAMLISPKNIKPTSSKLSVVGTFNPAAARLPNGDIVLYVRVAERLKEEASEDEKYYYAPRCAGEKVCKLKFDRFKKEEVQLKSSSDLIFKDETKRLLFISHFRRVILDRTGFRVKSIDKKPSFSGLKSNGELGVEDPRIAKIGDKYIMTYVSLSRHGNVSTSLAVSKDCLKWDRKGAIFSEQNKDVCLFQEKFKKFYYAFNRPEGGFQFTPPHMWVASSRDLINWGHNRPLVFSKKGKWDYERVGAGPPPVKTKKGWLLLYHGVINYRTREFQAAFGGRDSMSYEVGAALFDLKYPRKLIAKTSEPIIAPMKSYEKSGFINNVVFPTGLIPDENGEDLLVFSGGADTVTTVKKISIKDVLASMKKS
ncbi:MAG: hypothetical protein PHH00_02495 [Candidatus Nanoarchaeia archaeon]|nr:hypothetical protein [Candidatus Nanoarchaeia archaeon]